MKRWKLPLALGLLTGCAAAPVRDAPLQEAQVQRDLDFQTVRVAPTAAAPVGAAEGVPPALPPDARAISPSAIAPVSHDRQADLPSGEFSQTAALNDEVVPEPPLGPAPEATELSPLPFPATSELGLEDVIASVYQCYPLLRGAMFSRNIALGEQMAAVGEFDLKLKGASENGPTGFYQTYRQSIGLVQPTYGGGEVFAGYRIGRGDYQPWYLERQTNDGGEFKAGFATPLLQGADIDPRRAALWRSQYGRQLVEPEIQAQLIGFVQEASYAYWDWVLAGESFRIAERVLRLAEERTERIRSQVEAGLIDPPELTDNLRLVAERRAKLADSERKLQQTLAKLSLYLRDAQGRPAAPPAMEIPSFPDPSDPTVSKQPASIALALQQRPELAALDWQRRQIEVEHAQAANTLLPDLDAVVSGSQDVGQPTSKKRDKSEFELEASLFLDVPLQRRKAKGKLTSLEGKLAQLSAKRQMTADKIAVDVQVAAAARDAALVQVEQAREAVRLAEDLAERERQNFDLGASDLLKVTLREQYAAESALKAVEALWQYHTAEADLRAALGADRLAP